MNISFPISDYSTFYSIVHDIIDENNRLRQENEKYLSFITSLGVRLSSKEHESEHYHHAFQHIQREGQVIRDELTHLNSELKSLNEARGRSLSERQSDISKKDEKLRIAMQLIGELYNENQSLVSYIRDHQ